MLSISQKPSSERYEQESNEQLPRLATDYILREAIRHH
jgi:hypothetical protein